MASSDFKVIPFAKPIMGFLETPGAYFSKISNHRLRLYHLSKQITRKGETYRHPILINSIQFRKKHDIPHFIGGNMNIKKHPGLILILSALMVTVCRCSLTPGNPVTMKFTNGKSAQCMQFSEYTGTMQNNRFNTVNSYDCNIPCPDGSTVMVKLEGEATDKKITSNGKFDLAALQKQYCTKKSVQSEVTATAIPPLITIPNTATPVLTDLPLLTEEVTACDLKLGYVNFRMVKSPPNLVDKTLVIAINNTEVNCTVPSNNQSIYSCILPNKMNFPANITVKLDDTEVNNFAVSSNLCRADAPKNKPNEDQPTPNPNNPNNPNQQ